MFLRFSLMSAVLLFMLQLNSANAVTFNAADDFSATMNPNGPWSYGSYDSLGVPSSFVAFGGSSAGTNILGFPGFNGYAGAGTLIVAKNETAIDITTGTPTYPPGSLILHPSSLGVQAVVRWTAASAGNYDINGGFFATDLQGSTTTVDGSVYRNATQEFTGAVNGGTATDAPFSLMLALAAGDTIDFVVGFGADGSHLFDSTELRATISDGVAAVPVPAALPLFAGGLGLLGLMGWRRKRKVDAS